MPEIAAVVRGRVIAVYHAAATPAALAPVVWNRAVTPAPGEGVVVHPNHIAAGVVILFGRLRPWRVSLIRLHRQHASVPDDSGLGVLALAYSGECRKTQSCREVDFPRANDFGDSKAANSLDSAAVADGGSQFIGWI